MSADEKFVGLLMSQMLEHCHPVLLVSELESKFALRKRTPLHWVIDKSVDDAMFTFLIRLKKFQPEE